MTRHRTLIRLSAALAGVALVWACGGDSPTAPPTPEPARPATVTVTPATADLTALGATIQLTAEVRDQNATVMAGATVTWSSGDSSVATVDASGLVTGVAVGAATITARAGSGQGTAEITVMDRDRAALIALYEATDGPNWANSENWLTDTPLGEWYGVETDRSGRVVGLRMVENALSGPIPPELGDLYNLTRLDLRLNRLTGAIPPVLGRLAHLSFLDLGGNRLTGAIPPVLGSLANLVWLQLSLNALTGPIPAEFGGLTNLRTLHIFRNVLSGLLPRSLLELERLSTLTFDANDGLCAPGTADFSEWFEGLSLSNGPYCNESDRMVLRSLYEAATGTGWSDSRGWLEGVVLDDWYGVGADSIGRVTELDLNRNGLAGRLPPQLGQMARMTELRIGGNSLSGRLPESLSALSLRELHYADTELCTPPDESFRSWLTTISSHEGTGVECASLSERDILVALYDATLGPSWTSSNNWLTDAPLGEWHGVNVNVNGRVVSLNLSSNSLTGPIPPELGSLADLTTLWLGDNDLSGPIPPELGNLANLTGLYLSSNNLSGPIPPELGDFAILGILQLGWNNLTGAIPPELGNLTNLQWLALDGNDLTGAIPPELGSLANLANLSLHENDLTGAIPPELGNLTNLWVLTLDGNNLTGAIPPGLGDLTNLRYLFADRNDLTGRIPPELGSLASLNGLDLADNELTGRIPPELGSLAELESLFLQINDLQGAVPPELSRLVSLRELALSRNVRMFGALPLSLTALSQLATFVAQGTDLCAPSDADFLDWLGGIPVQRVALCGGARVMTYLTQAVQSPEFPVPLVADEEALLRVFVTASRSNDERIPPVRATFYRNGAQSHVVNLPGKAGPIPTAVQEGELERSANAGIPGRLVQPGLEMVIEVDPERTLDPGLGVTKRIPETGRLAVEVRAMPLFDLTVIPFLWAESSDSSILGITEDLTADSDLLWETRTLLPVTDFDVTVHAPVFSSTNNAYDLLRQTEAIRTMEGGSGHYMGTMTQPVAGGVRGLAGRPGRVSFSIPVGWVMAHELGHNMSLQHTWTNPLYPSYPNGRIGVWGYDFRNRGRLVPPDVNDVMLGGQVTWISDFHFTQALRFRQSDADGVGATWAWATGPVQAKSLLLWGGISADSVPFLEPAFVVDATAALPDTAGEYRLTGHTTAGGRELFSLAFAMPEVADGDGSSSFAFVLPVQPGWEGNLASITLSGPGGSATLDGDTDLPMTVLLDPVNGQVRAILRDLPQADAAAALAPQAGLDSLDVLFSRGIPDAAAWSR